MCQYSSLLYYGHFFKYNNLGKTNYKVSSWIPKLQTPLIQHYYTYNSKISYIIFDLNELSKIVFPSKTLYYLWKTSNSNGILNLNYLCTTPRACMCRTADTSCAARDLARFSGKPRATPRAASTCEHRSPPPAASITTYRRGPCWGD